MNSRSLSDDIFDLSLGRSLKNLVDRKSLPENGRDKLLAAAAQQEKPLHKRKLLKFNLSWFFRYNETQQGYPIRPISNFEFEYMDFLKTGMAFL